MTIRNVVFDLGGVVLGRDFERCTAESLKFFSFLRGEDFPTCWKEFDRGMLSAMETAGELARSSGRTPQECLSFIEEARLAFNEFPETVALIRRLHARGYKLYVLSNMPREFWEQMRGFEVFRYFEGVVISSQEHMLKPDPALFRLLLDRYGLRPGETLFVDDKAMNVTAAAALGMETFRFVGAEESCRRLGDLLLRPKV